MTVRMGMVFRFSLLMTSVAEERRKEETRVFQETFSRVWAELGGFRGGYGGGQGRSGGGGDFFFGGDDEYISDYDDEEYDYDSDEEDQEEYY